MICDNFNIKSQIQFQNNIFRSRYGYQKNNMKETSKTDKPRRKRTTRNGHKITDPRYRTTKIPYRTRTTKPLPDIDKIDEYNEHEVLAVTLLNRDKEGKPTHRGRPTDYQQKYDHLAYTLVKVHGLTIEQLAEVLRTNVPCIKRWRDTYPNFNMSIKKGRDEFDGHEIKKSLKARATGMKITEKSKKYKRTPIYEGKGDKQKIVDWEMKLVEETVNNKVLAPDVGAIAWWQKNRDPGEWRDRKAVEISGPDGGPVESITTNMDPKEAAVIYSQLLKGDG